MTGPALLRQLRDGVAAVQAKDFATARTLLQPIADAFPNDARPWFWLAVASPSADAAIPCLRRVLAIDPSHAQARPALAKLLLTHASSLVTAGRRDDARALVGEASELTPETDRVWVALAIVSDDPAVRLDALRRAHTINPLPATRTHLIHALLQRAQALAGDNRDEGRQLYEQVVELDRGDMRAWQGLVELADTTAAALEMARALIAAAPEQQAGAALLKKALIADARALELEARSDEACLRWREALTIDQYDIDAWLGLATSTSDEDEAQRAITTAFDIDPNDARVSSAMARIQDATWDAATFEIPQDAFAHLEGGDDLFAAPGGELAAPVAADADPFARFAPMEPAAEEPSPVAAARSAEPEPAPVMAETWTASAIDEPITTMAPEPMIAVEPAVPPELMAPESPALPSEKAVVESDVRSSEDSPRRAVMIVDDSPTIRKILGLTLERAGYKVAAEPDGESALERLSQTVPDVILLDIAMPKIDGYEVCRRIKGDPRTSHVPVVMLSGKDGFFDKVKGRVAGASEYLTKPFETPAVLAAVAAACQQPVCR